MDVRSQLAALLIVLLTLSCAPWLAAQPLAPSLDRGFQLLYGFRFEDAEHQFQAWQDVHPAEALGSLGEAATLLFSELDRLGILESKFFVSDSAFSSRRRLNPDQAVRQHFERSLQQGESLALETLTAHPQDPDALFAMALANGLRADYLSLVENSNLSAFRPTKNANFWADKLLQIAPSYYDAYVATGITQYLVGSLPFPTRLLAGMGGLHGDKARGMRELQVAAEHGHYLAPFARILLAIAELRAGHCAAARQRLLELAQDFPANPLFPRELRRLDERGCGG